MSLIRGLHRRPLVLIATIHVSNMSSMISILCPNDDWMSMVYASAFILGDHCFATINEA